MVLNIEVSAVGPVCFLILTKMDFFFNELEEPTDMELLEEKLCSKELLCVKGLHV